MSIIKSKYNISTKADIKFATNFSIYNFQDFKYVEVLGDKDKKYSYILYKKNKPEVRCNDLLKIKIPLSRIVSLSTTHLKALVMLNEQISLIGFSNTNLINNKFVRKQVERGHTLDVGFPVQLEKVIKLAPDAVFAHTMDELEVEGLDKMLKISIPLVFNGDYRERHPLGRAEWIKFIAVFFEKGELADIIFNGIEKKYNEIRLSVKKLKRPKVLIGSHQGGIWYAPNSKSDMAILVSDAGGDYILEDSGTFGTVTLSFEKIWSLSNKVEIWLTNNMWKTKSDILKEDNRYSKLNIFKRDRVYNYNKLMNEWGGIDFWESGAMRPDLVLLDLVYIFHPNVKKSHKTIWYQRLR